MFKQTRFYSRDFSCRIPISAKHKKIHSESGSYGPESLKEIQKIFDGAWRDVEKSVFPWDVHAARERLAILVFQHVSNSDGAMSSISSKGSCDPGS
jgi:hypothetical protein